MVTDSYMSLNVGVHGEYVIMMTGSLGYKSSFTHNYAKVSCPSRDVAHININCGGVHCGHGVI